MKPFFLLLAFSLLCGAGAQVKPTNKMWFVFLVRGSTPRPDDEEAVLKMQAAHIGNFQRRFAEGKLIAAGPLRDPTERRRGIVVLTVPTKADVRKAFEGDPYVENGIMNLEAFEWTADRAAIDTKAVDPNAIEEYRLAMIRRKDVKGTKTVPPSKGYWQSLGKAGPSALGSLVGAPSGAQLLLFATKDDAAVRKAVLGSPAGKDASFEVEVLPLWMAKGTISTPK